MPSLSRVSSVAARGLARFSPASAAAGMRGCGLNGNGGCGAHAASSPWILENRNSSAALLCGGGSTRSLSLSARMGKEDHDPMTQI